MKKKGIVIAGLTIALFVVVTGLFFFGVIQNSSKGFPDDVQMLPPSGRQDDNTLTEASCSDAGGTWNPCGSACRTDPDAICIELCVEYCQCISDSECPLGYTCGDFIEGVGVCL